MKPQKNRYPRWIKAALLMTLLVWFVCGHVFGQNATARAQDGQGVAENQTPISQAVINSLTAKERAWLSAHPVIRVVQDPGWPPVEFVDERGDPSGMTGDYLKIVEQRLGVKFERVHGLAWQEAYARLKRREIDMTTSVAVTPERNEFWAFTKPYMKIPIVIIAHADVTYIADLTELAGKKVAVVDGYAVSDWIPRDFPDIRLIRVSNAKEGLELLQKGEVFAYVDNMLIVGYYLAKWKMTNLKIVGKTPYVNDQCMAVRKDWAPLTGILQKALDSISETEHNNIYRKWLPIRYEHGFDYTLLWYLLAIFTLIMSGLAAWNWKLAREIRSRKEAEKALVNSENKFKLIFETANVGKSITLPTGGINVNQAFCDMLGYAREELRNKRWQDITPADDIETTQKQIYTLLQGQKDSARFNKRYLHKNGSCIWADVSVTMHRDVDRNPLFFITTIIDITERKRAEEALGKSEKRIWKFLDSTLDMAFLKDESFCHIMVNSALCKFYGKTESEILGKTDFDLMDEKAATECRKTDEQTLLLNDTHISEEVVGDRCYETRKFPVVIKDGKRGIGAYIRDITERKLAESQREAALEEIHRLYAKLEEKVDERTTDLHNSQLALLNLVDDLSQSAKNTDLAHQKLEETNKELGAFSYSVSHDLRAPLRSIDGFSLALLEDYQNKLDDTGKNYLNKIRAAAQHMGLLIEDILKLSRITHAELLRESIDLSKIVQSIAETFQQGSPDQDMKITIQEGIVINGDLNAMRIAMTNLLENAWKFTGKQKHPSIEFGMTLTEDKKVFFIRDNGVGFDMAYAGKLFGAFQRLHGIYEFPGTGIGLATVKRIITRHGGQIWAEAEIGKGAVFYFTLP